jgi:hypothetical protein
MANGTQVQDPLTKALEFFKDWSNYLLVTTVAALGWVASGTTTFTSHSVKPWCVWLFALSVVFGIFTLALIPLVQEQRGREKTHVSNYDVDAQFWGGHLRLIQVCFAQHVLFIFGILTYAYATTFR